MSESTFYVGPITTFLANIVTLTYNHHKNLTGL